MAGAAGALLRAGLAVKLGQVRQATSSYLRDRTEQGRSTLNAYLIGVGFWLVAGVFMIAALLVGAAALFYWMDIRYGTFTAFGITAAALVLMSALASVIAASSARPVKTQFPSLGSRLRVAVRATPAKTAAKRADTAPSVVPGNRDHVASARNTATAILRAPAMPKRDAMPSTSPTVQRAGIAAAVGLLGWALARRYGQTRVPKPRVRT